MNIPWKRHTPGQPIDREDWNDNVILATNLFNLAQGRQFKRVSPAQIDGIAEKTGCTFTGNLTTQAPVDGVRIADLDRVLRMLEKNKKTYIVRSEYLRLDVDTWTEKNLDLLGEKYMRWYEWRCNLYTVPDGFAWKNSLVVPTIVYDCNFTAENLAAPGVEKEIKFRNLPVTKILDEGDPLHERAEWDVDDLIHSSVNVDGFYIGPKEFKDNSGLVVIGDDLYLSNMVFFLGTDPSKHAMGGVPPDDIRLSVLDKTEAAWIGHLPAYRTGCLLPQTNTNDLQIYDITINRFRIHVLFSAIFWR